MVALYKDPQGENVFKRMESNTVDTQMSSSSTLGPKSNSTTNNNDLNALQERVTQLEEELRREKTKLTD